MTEQFLPNLLRLGRPNQFRADYIFEPSKKLEIVVAVILKSLKTQLYKVITRFIASEHGARMTAIAPQ